MGRSVRRVRPPGSKSITNRALVVRGLGRWRVDAYRCARQRRHAGDDRRARQFGDRGRGYATAAERSIVHGAGGEIPALEAELFCANSGTTIRFLTALATLGHGAFRLDGVERMRERPIGDLLDALNQLGADVRSENDERLPARGCPRQRIARRNGHGARRYLQPVPQRPVDGSAGGALARRT